MDRKLISIIIMIFIIIQGIFLGTSYSEASSEQANFSVSSNTGSIGDEVSIDINLNNDSDFVSANFVLNYNTNDLEYISYTEGKILEEAAMNIVKNNSNTGKIAIGYIADPSSDDKTVKAGNILKIVFKLKANMNKESELKLECTSLENEDETNIIANITNGKITRVENKNDNTSGDNNNQEDNNTSSGNNNQEDNNTSSGNNNTQQNNNTSSGNNNTQQNNNTTSGNNNTQQNNNTTSGNNQQNNKTEAEKDFPKAGISTKIIFVIVCLILTSIVLYKQNNYMREIK